MLIENPSRRPVVVEVRGRYRSYYRPLDAEARWPDGSRKRVVVKTQVNHPIPITPAHLFSEWCGYAVAHLLGVPTPPAYIVDLPADSLIPLGSDASDIVPGLAFATENQLQSVDCGVFGFPKAASIRNVESVAGMLVLDTLMRNRDRNDDVLAVPIEHTTKWELRYIDNGWVVYFREPAPERIEGEFPTSLPLRRLLHRLEALPPYLLDAASLDIDHLEREFQAVPADFLSGFRDTVRAVAETVAWRGKHCAEAIERSRPPDI